MNRFRRICVWLACLIAVMVIFTVCDVNNNAKANKRKGGVVMTDMVKQALILSGADSENFNEKDPKFSEQMIMESAAYVQELLTQKYPGVKFEMTACVPGSIVQSYDEFTMNPVGCPEDEFTVHVTRGEALEGTDSYYGVLRASDYEALVKEKLTAAEPDAQVFSTIDYQFGPEWDAKASIEQAITDTGMYAYTWILLRGSNENFTGRASAIEQIMREAKLKGDYAVYLLVDDAGDMTKQEAFERIPANNQHQVYTEIYRFIAQ